MSRYTVVYEGDPTDVKFFSGEPAPGQAVTVSSGDEVENRQRLTRERDAAIAQRDRAVAALKEAADDIYAWGQYAGDYFQDKHDLAGEVQRYKDIATSIADTPVPDRLAAEREAGRREKAEFEAAAKKIYEGFAFLPGYVPWVEGGNSDKQEEARQLVRRALRDTPAAPVEGGET